MINLKDRTLHHNMIVLKTTVCSPQIQPSGKPLSARVPHRDTMSTWRGLEHIGAAGVVPALLRK